MSSILDKPAVRQAALPIAVEQYHRLGELGIIAENTELLHGVIVEKTIKSPRHTWLVQQLADWLREAVDERHHVRQEQPLTLADSEPEPDLAVVSGSPDEYRAAHPSTAQLVIEVAVVTADLDREKADLYAAAGMPEFWLVLADDETVEIYDGPSASGYASCRRCSRSDTLRAPCLPRAELKLGALFD